MTEEEMEGPISFWGYKEQESNLILPEHDDDDDEKWQEDEEEDVGSYWMTLRKGEDTVIWRRKL